MKTKSVLVAVAILTAVAAVTMCDAATDLVINEISPVASEGGHAWIELFNPTREEVSIAGLVVENGETEPFEVPESFPSLRSGGYLLIRFGPGDPGVQEEDGPPHLIVVTVPEHSVWGWLPSRGELMVKRPSATSEHALELVDYVAWGTRGAEWSRIPQRYLLWGEHSFVPLAESFGGYDPTVEIAPDGSIGLYPGGTTRGPKNWTIYDPDETSQGARNGVPRPKAFTLANGVTIGSQSLAVGWARRNGDEWYRFQLAADPDFGRIVIDELSVTPVIRVGEALPQGRYFYRISAFSGGVESRMSYGREVLLGATSCDWSLPPVQWKKDQKMGFGDWIVSQTCSELPVCEMISSIQFKFQRKDTRLLCAAGCETNDFHPCSWDSPHPYCQKVTFRGDVPSFFVCAGGLLSPLCGMTPGATSNTVTTPIESGMNPYPHWAWFRYSNDFLENWCDHGANYCAMASISMMASAYGACLSQDRIAYWMREGDVDLEHGELAHDIETIQELATNALKWALGIPNRFFKEDPNPHIVDWRDRSQPAFVAARFTPDNPQTIEFETVSFWIRARRPIMGLSGFHYRVVAGFCKDEFDGEWLYVYDPISGPLVERFSDWKAATISAPPAASGIARSVWVGPPIGSWTNTISDQGVWEDSDEDGLMNFDEDRFGTDKGNPDTDSNPPGDKEEQIPPP